MLTQIFPMSSISLVRWVLSPEVIFKTSMKIDKVQNLYKISKVQRISTQNLTKSTSKCIPLKMVLSVYPEEVLHRSQQWWKWSLLSQGGPSLYRLGWTYAAMARHIAPWRAMSRHVSPYPSMSGHVWPCLAMSAKVKLRINFLPKQCEFLYTRWLPSKT